MPWSIDDVVLARRKLSVHNYLEMCVKTETAPDLETIKWLCGAVAGDFVKEVLEYARIVYSVMTGGDDIWNLTLN